MIRYGIIGCGAIAPVHAEALTKIDGAALATAFDVVPERAKAFAERFGCLAANSLRSLFDACDAVIVCTPSGLHADVGILAAQAGKHVITEKPIDVSFESAKALVEAGRHSGIKLATISQHRFSNAVQRTRLAAQNGELGDLLAGDATIKWYRTQAYYDSGDWRGTWALDGGGCLINQGVHMIDMIQWIMGGVRSVQAQVRTSAHQIEVEDIAQALVEYKNGAIGVIYGSTSFFPGMAERLEVHGKHGTVVLEGDRVKMWKADPIAAAEGLYGGGVMMQPTPTQHTADRNEAELISASAEDPTAKWGEQHRLQLEDFTRAILDDREPLLTGEASLEPLKIILGIYRSARENGARIQI
ncbi:MAG: Gfo/Idh/MocA family oxidoreductase [Fimbriimonadaceae bacterium]|nr:Gfo/Idh/MocA family oxidoreductase [Fimbriimonadaceae bacterium]